MNGYQNEIQQYTMGYRALPCFSAHCIRADHELCELQGAGVFTVAASRPPDLDSSSGSGSSSSSSGSSDTSFDDDDVDDSSDETSDSSS